MKGKIKEPLITIVVPAYNTGEYISECLESLLAQTIGLRRIKIIVIDDNSQDGTPEILKKYRTDYPEIITVISNRKNLGPGASRNKGLKMVTTPFVAFVDSDDFVDKNAFKFLVSKMQKTDSQIGIYEFKYLSKSGKKYERNPSHRIFNMNRTLERWEYPIHPELIHALGASNKLFETELISRSQVGFDEGKKFEDAYFSLKTMLEAERIYVTDKVTYWYRKREDSENKSGQDRLYEDKHSYLDHLDLNLRIKKLIDEHRDMEFSLNWLNIRTWSGFWERLVNKKTTPKFGKQERIEMLEKTKALFNGVDSQNTLPDVSFRHSLLIRIVHNSESLSSVRLKYSVYRILGLFSRLPWVGVVAKRAKGIVGYLADRSFKLAELLKTYMEYYYLKPAAKRLIKSKGQIILLCERGDEANDNAYVLFKYIRNNHPDINAYYLISESAPVHNLEKVRRLGNVINYGSKQHKTYFIAANKLISTHARGYIEPWKFPNTLRVMRKKYWSKRYVFLQHGITINDVSKMLGPMSQSANFDLFICGAKKEYEYVSKNFGYDMKTVKHTGFARFDELYRHKSKTLSTKPTILLMPTWRNYVVQSSWADKMHTQKVNDQIFLKSDYYYKFQKLINDPDLKRILESIDGRLIFYPHYEAQRYLKYFSSKNERVIIAAKEQHSVQDLLIKGSILITDYSSVSMDFAYMEKPSIYYQFDKEEFFQKQYKKGYFDYERDAFGSVASDLNGVLTALKGYASKDFSIEDKYKSRSLDFFGIKDENNSERIYTEISKL